MYRNIYLLLICFILNCYSIQNIKKQNSNKKNIDVIIHLEPLRNIKGNLILCIYSRAEKETYGFIPCEAAYIKIEISAGILNKQENKIIIRNIPQGEYAFYLVHDQIPNNSYDYNREVPERYLGFIPGWLTEIFSPTFPVEGEGYSNYHRPVFFDPKFKNTAIYLDKDHNNVHLHISYFWNYMGGISSIMVTAGWIGTFIK